MKTLIAFLNLLLFLVQSFLVQSLLYLLGVVLVLNHPYIKRVAIFAYYKRR
jgi:hypothetical protein